MVQVDRQLVAVSNQSDQQKQNNGILHQDNQSRCDVHSLEEPILGVEVFGNHFWVKFRLNCFVQFWKKNWHDCFGFFLQNVVILDG
jgi:hypothetical protein